MVKAFYSKPKFQAYPSGNSKCKKAEKIRMIGPKCAERYYTGKFRSNKYPAKSNACESHVKFK